VQPSVAVEAEGKVKTGKQDEWAYGFRFKGTAFKTLDYSAEWIGELGHDGENNIKAWATTFGAGYRIDKLWSKPRFFWQYDFASGDSNPTDGQHGTFDTMYPTAHDRFGQADLFGWQNIESVRAGTTIEPHRRLTFTVQGLDDWAADALDSIYNTSGGAIVSNKTDHGRHVGAELDGYSWYELNRHFNLGGGFGYFGGGQFLTNVTTSHSYTYYYFALNFKDNGKH
jgi:hypothetical protein